MFRWTLATASLEATSLSTQLVATSDPGLETTLSAANLSLQTSNRKYLMLSTRFPGIYTCDKTTCLYVKTKKWKNDNKNPNKNTPQVVTCIRNKDLQNVAT